jgi:selenocysteine-specific elongation factor
LKQLILGTAGHIDHGKTSLIKAVTGIDTDRLKEEKKRGITIELGFAYLELPSGQRLGVVDVPGHEKFVKNMVAGATGIDIVAMVVAADEGVMPQTREHMEICTLLGIEQGVLVLTKIDLVDEEWLALVIDDIRDFTGQTFLQNAPIVPVSAATGEGLPAFVKALDDIGSTIPERPPTDIFRLPVDRVFSMKGFGTVITGTLISGSLEVGESIMIYPSCITAKVRGIQAHNQSVNRAEAGMRTAVNFQGLEKDAVNRGDVLASVGALKPNYMLDVSIHYLKSNKKPLKNRARVRFHSGTTEVLGLIVLLEKDELVPGETTVAQLRLDKPVAVIGDDRFVIRSYSPVRTIGGGRVLNPIPKKQKRFQAEVVAGLKSLLDSSPEDKVSYLVRESGYRGRSFSDIKIMTNLHGKILHNILGQLLSKRLIVLVDKENQLYIHREAVAKLKNETIENLARYHKTNPLKAGIPKEELKSKFSAFVGPKLFHMLINEMTKSGEVVQTENLVRTASHKVFLGVEQKDTKNKLVDAYKSAGLTPPYFKDVCRTLDLDPLHAKDVLALLLDEGQITKVKEDLYFHTDAVEDLRKRLIDFLEANGEMTTPQFKEIAGVSRKYLIPLIEYFDTTNVTIRIGDIRKLRSG